MTIIISYYWDYNGLKSKVKKIMSTDIFPYDSDFAA